tara:strand:- start:1794 stop:2375 length:582 start_codon:yes stop_codon:yes gene_type:complete
MKKFFLIFYVGIAINNIQKAFGAEEGMPQLNPEYWYAQIFWLILIFSILYLIIWKVFLPRISNNIENRRLRIINDLNETEKLKENAEKKLKEYEKIIENSKKEAKKILQENQKKLENDLDKKKQILDEEINKEIKAAENEIMSLKKSSINSINKIAIEISSEILKQTIGKELNMSSVSAVVEDISKKKIDKYL